MRQRPLTPVHSVKGHLKIGNEELQDVIIAYKGHIFLSSPTFRRDKMASFVNLI